LSPRGYPRKVLRLAAKEFLAINITRKPKQHRRFRRRPRYIQDNYGRRTAGGNRWLETHIWHAKRFVFCFLFVFVFFCFSETF
jgi:hypothetical protein